ncbi:MCM N-terminal domain [Fusarium oxysporum f. sp. vasinfectum]|nr:MCM N-terminal domain [Fusarium oxysporum f. sp. vasinfectum]
MDRGSIYSAHVYEPSYAENGDTRMQLQTQLETFILDFRLDNNFVYRDQLRENALLKRYFCDVNINDLISFNEELAHRLTSEPAEIIPLVGTTQRATYKSLTSQ